MLPTTRTRKKKFQPAEILEIAWVIRMLLDCHALGLEILLGKAAFPSTQELSDMMDYIRGPSAGMEELGTKVQSGGGQPQAQKIIEGAEYIENIVERAGGRERFIAAFRHCASERSEGYRILVDWRKVETGRPYKGNDPASILLEQKYCAHVSTLRRHRNSLIEQIARQVKYPTFPEFELQRQRIDAVA